MVSGGILKQIIIGLGADVFGADLQFVGNLLVLVVIYLDKLVFAHSE